MGLFCFLSSMTRNLRNSSKTYKTPRRPFEKERLSRELKVVGEYGLRCKREVWRVQVTLAKLRKAARELLTLEEKDPKRIFEGAAIMRRCQRLGLLDESKLSLDYVLSLNAPSSPSSSSSISPSRSTTPACSSASVTSASAARSSTCPPSWSASSPRSTSTLPSTPPTVTASPAASSAASSLPRPPRMTVVRSPTKHK